MKVWLEGACLAMLLANVAMHGYLMLGGTDHAEPRETEFVCHIEDGEILIRRD